MPFTPSSPFPACSPAGAMPSCSSSLALPFPVQIRRDRLLAQELGVPRSRLPHLVDAARALRRPVFDGQLVLLAAEP